MGDRILKDAEVDRKGNSPNPGIVYWGYIGIMEKKMESTIVYWGYMGLWKRKWNLL